MSAFDDLMAHQRETEALSAVMGRLGWDQETMMPRGAAEQRSDEFGAVESILHQRRTDPRRRRRHPGAGLGQHGDNRVLPQKGGFAGA